LHVTDDSLAMIITVVGGSGSVGSALAIRLAASGHQIVVAARDVQSARVGTAIGRIAAAAPKSSKVPPPSASAIRTACDSADAIIIAIPGMPTADAMAHVASEMGPCRGKPLIDCTNPLTAWPALEISCDRNATSATEEFAKVFPECGELYSHPRLLCLLHDQLLTTTS
jgi:predicted dinucleotide-binding enzyme